MEVPTLVEAVNTYQRARDWAPEWVGTYLRHDIETGRALSQDAALLAAHAARAAAVGDPQQAQQLLHAAEGIRGKARTLNAEAKDLAVIDQARAAWHAHTDPQRQAAARALAELRRRRLGPDGQPLPPPAAKKPKNKDTQRRSNREAVSYTGDITAALERAHQAKQRIQAETPARHPARQPNEAEPPTPRDT